MKKARMKMKTYRYFPCLYILPLLLLLFLSEEMLAQEVERRVEVSKSYRPEVESHPKLSITPDWTDTVKLRPEIDYTVAPRVLNTHLNTRTFRPAILTYWEFNRPTPLYLKVGAGYPLNSEADLLLSTQNPSIGYALLELNHRGDWSKIRNAAGSKVASSRSYNRLGGAAGRYLGRHILEGKLYYENRLDHRYGATSLLDTKWVGSRINFGEAGIRIRLGDEIENEKKICFNLEGYGRFFHDESEPVIPWKGREAAAGGSGSISFRWGSHRLNFRAGYDGTWGLNDWEDFHNRQILGGFRYTFTTPTVDAEVGFDYRYLSRTTTEGRFDYHYPTPYLRLLFNPGNGAFVPFVEFDSRLETNTLRELMRENPYLYTGTCAKKNTVGYNLRFGIEGNLSNRFSYRLFVVMSRVENARYWYGINAWSEEHTGENFLLFGLTQARRNSATLGGELKWRPGQDWLIQFLLHGHLHDFTARFGDHLLGGGLPALESTLKVEYSHRRFSIGASAELASSRNWSNLRQISATVWDAPECFHVPITVDVRLHFDYHLNNRLTLYAEGQNLANQRLYRWANYPLWGAGFTVGVRMNF